MMKLYELTNEWSNLADQAMLDDGAPEALLESLKSLQVSIEDKFENTIKVARGLSAYAEACKAEADYLAGKAKRAQERSDWLLNYMRACMKEIGLTQTRAGIFDIKIGVNPPKVMVAEDAKIDDRFMKPQPSLIDKTALKEALKAGEKIEGAWLEIGERLIIK